MRIGGVLEKIVQPLWDTLTIANTDTLAQFFTVGIGGTKTLALTNLVNPGSLPAPESYEIRGFSLDFPQAISLADLRIILTDSFLEFFVNTKVMLELPLTEIGAAGGLWAGLAIDDAAAVSTTDDTQANNGFPATGNLFAIPVPIEIEIKENFRADITFATAIAGLASSRAMSLMLHGHKTRSVQ